MREVDRSCGFGGVTLHHLCGSRNQGSGGNVEVIDDCRMGRLDCLCGSPISEAFLNVKLDR